MKIEILEKKYLQKIVGSDIPISFYFLPIISYFYLKRLKMAAELLKDEKFNNLLELGYGSGIFLPELSKRTKNLYAIDIKNNVKVVSEILQRKKISTKLFVGSALDLPFENEQFDCIVCLSVLEHIEDLDRALKEIARALNKNGIAIFGFPVKNFYLDLFFKLVGFNPDEIHPSSHIKIMKYIDRYFSIVEKRIFTFIVSLYFVYKCSKKSHEQPLHTLI